MFVVCWFNVFLQRFPISSAEQLKCVDIGMPRIFSIPPVEIFLLRSMSELVNSWRVFSP